MAVTKRTRFEVLRRDNHTCQYCGAKAPDVTLHIDHVMPVALGGDDKPGNLVTACRDCNAGKTSITPDSPLVEGLSDRAAAYALGMQDKMTRFRAEFESLEEYTNSFDAIWDGWQTSSGNPVEKPAAYKGSLFRWMKMGVPIAAYELAIPIAMEKTNIRGEGGRFNYMGGVVQRMIDEREIDLTVREDLVAVYTDADMDEIREDAFRLGHEHGFRRGAAAANTQALSRDHLQHHIDKTEMVLETNPIDSELVRYTGKVVRVGTYQDDKT